ncbi:deleted in malignant brain tumors 1 protein-like [Chanos chanos]|uniref:Soluble scavenger receptor cysteine-rich domain-containing protein SSC5D n=1 Tax=Chanos chanos TaxID=29144 RepID=A0A6J2VLB9_CHACN|nr:deleted in malignant brain tumors 1 protein-like [Chanos chanos]
MERCLRVFFLSSMFHLITGDSVRLVDGGSRCAGRVEVLHDGQWGTVCSHGWDLTDAAVVCRELGCGETVKAPRNAYFGEGSGPIWMSLVDCRESDTALKNCKSEQWGNNNCDHSEDAGVICSGSVRLVNGGRRCAGRVEVFHDGEWGTVCGHGWDMTNAAVVCRELGCGDAEESLMNAHFGPGSGQIWMDDVKCNKSDTTLKNCRFGGWGKHDCDHGEDVSVVCSDSVRLVDGGSRCAGRVQVLHDGQWGTVCSIHWHKTDVAVVCRELGYRNEGVDMAVLIVGMLEPSAQAL